MQSIIIYYSYTGNTKRVASFLGEHLRQMGAVEVVELKSLDEPDKFLGQAFRAFRHKRAKIDPASSDLKKYDLICLGTPVWAFAPAPAMNTYLDQCYGLEGKEVILFTTYGSGTGNTRCLNYMQEILSKKGARKLNRFSIQQFKVKDKEFVLAKIQEVARL